MLLLRLVNKHCEKAGFHVFTFSERWTMVRLRFWVNHSMARPGNGSNRLKGLVSRGVEIMTSWGWLCQSQKIKLQGIYQKVAEKNKIRDTDSHTVSVAGQQRGCRLQLFRIGFVGSGSEGGDPTCDNNLRRCLWNVEWRVIKIRGIANEHSADTRRRQHSSTKKGDATNPVDN